MPQFQFCQLYQMSAHGLLLWAMDKLQISDGSILPLILLHYRYFCPEISAILTYYRHPLVQRSSAVLLVLTTSLLLWYTTSELWWLSGEKRGDYQNCSVLKLCTVISTLRWAVLTNCGDLTLSIIELLNVRSLIWTYQFFPHFSVRLPQSDPIS